MSATFPSGIIDAISPAYARSAALSLTPANPLVPARAFQPFGVLVAVTGLALETGLSFPLDLTITPPSARLGAKGRAAVVRHAFRRVVPSRLSFVPREGGIHLIKLAERQHNLFWGYLVVDVLGAGAEES